MLYGNVEDMEESHHVGTKYLWVANNGVLEMHGKEKVSWTHLNEHIFRDNIPVEQLFWRQHRWGANIHSGNDNHIGNRLVFHVLSEEGDLKDTYQFRNGTHTDEIQSYVDSFDDNEIFLFFSDYVT